MSALAVLAFCARAAATFGATFVLARIAGKLGWRDAPSEQTAARKLQGRPVPPVGGVALALGACVLGVAPLAAEFDRAAELLPALPWPRPEAALLALALAFGVGLVDDLLRDGLAPASKLALQLAAALPLAASILVREGLPALLPAVLLVFLAAWSMNAANTFDNSDGALALGALAGLATHPTLAAPLLGLLPLQLDARERTLGPHATPTAYLGDAGSHALGLALLLLPYGWPLLLLASLDLLRLARVRIEAGSRPWIGDRRHLGHMLARRLASRPAIACALALPVLSGHAALRVLGLSTRGFALASLLVALGFVLLLSSARRAHACPDGGTSE